MQPQSMPLARRRLVRLPSSRAASPVRRLRPSHAVAALLLAHPAACPHTSTSATDAFVSATGRLPHRPSSRASFWLRFALSPCPSAPGGLPRVRCFPSAASPHTLIHPPTAPPCMSPPKASHLPPAVAAADGAGSGEISCVHATCRRVALAGVAGGGTGLSGALTLSDSGHSRRLGPAACRGDRRLRKGRQSSAVHAAAVAASSGWLVARTSRYATPPSVSSLCKSDRRTLCVGGGGWGEVSPRRRRRDGG